MSYACLVHIQVYRVKGRGVEKGRNVLFKFRVLLLFYTLCYFLSFSINLKFYRHFNPFFQNEVKGESGKRNVRVNV